MMHNESDKHGLQAEQDSFNALAVGFKATLEWHENIFSHNVVKARVESATTSDMRRLAYTLKLFAADSEKVLHQEHKRDVLMPFDDDSKNYAAEIKLPLDNKDWATAHTAHFEYNVYEKAKEIHLSHYVQSNFDMQQSVASDTLVVEKKPT